MSTLDCANKSNGEVPVYLQELADKFPRKDRETPGEYFRRLEHVNTKRSPK
jgi:hypothetical protein